MAKKRLYLAYGSNLSEAQMAIRCPDAKIIGTATLKNWRLLFKVHATVEPTPPAWGYSVPVAVWELTPDCENSLDRYEGYRPDGSGYYMKKHIWVWIGNAKRKAMMYVMNERPLQLPYRDYFDVIQTAYASLGFDMAVLDTALTESRGGTSRKNSEAFQPNRKPQGT
jgi:gamma-glutamylcyclotransferase (GGCT)/AIG2-like uncharacterized protein YtfP